MGNNKLDTRLVFGDLNFCLLFSIFFHKFKSTHRSEIVSLPKLKILSEINLNSSIVGLKVHLLEVQIHSFFEIVNNPRFSKK